MSRKRDTNWARNEITVLLDAITEITRKRAQDGKKTNSREIFEYAARKLGEKGHTARAEREKCRAKWKKMKEEYTHAKRAREGDINFKEAPGIVPFYDRMEMLINGPFDNISPHSTIVRRANSMSNSSSTSNTSSVSNNNTKATNSSTTNATRTPTTSSSTTQPTLTPTLTGDQFSISGNNTNNNNATNSADHDISSNDNTNQMDDSNSNVIITSLCSSNGRHLSGLRASARIAANTTIPSTAPASVSTSTPLPNTISGQSNQLNNNTNNVANQSTLITTNGLNDNGPTKSHNSSSNSGSSINSTNDFTRTPTSSSSLSFDNNNPIPRNDSSNKNTNNLSIESSTPASNNSIVLGNTQRSTPTINQQSHLHPEQNKMTNNDNSNHQPLIGINNMTRSASSTSSTTSTSTTSANTTSVNNNLNNMPISSHHLSQPITMQQQNQQHPHQQTLNPGSSDFCSAQYNNSSASSLTAPNLCAIRPKEADVSYRVSAGCRQITIFGDQDIDIKFRGDCVTINKIELDYTGTDGS